MLSVASKVFILLWHFCLAGCRRSVPALPKPAAAWPEGETEETRAGARSLGKLMAAKQPFKLGLPDEEMSDKPDVACRRPSPSPKPAIKAQLQRERRGLALLKDW
mmetsp:Transcript_64741/g.104659  ORF Transcript_64741/g.104659 Transcript_64741/m.104659 type:complete len:105 (-) Transcript_64741:172-486(-)